MQHEMKFLQAAIEDVVFSRTLFKEKKCQPRHVLFLLHDALEFIFYETLQASSLDVYNDGQNTIGFDAAFSLAVKNGVKIPFVATLREIQKLRGDAKHHAQNITWEKAEELSCRWEIIVSSIIYENFLDTELNNNIEKVLANYSIGQIKLYQNQRNKNWPNALSHLIKSIWSKIQKSHGLYGSAKCFQGIQPKEILARTINEVRKGSKSGEVDIVLPFLIEAQRLLQENGDEAACEPLVKLNEQIDRALPICFDLKTSQKITDNLYLASLDNFSATSGWHRWGSNDTKGYRTLANEIVDILRKHPDVTERFGKPDEDIEEDNIRRWWDFVVYHDGRWHSFILSTGFQISPESYSDQDDSPRLREEIAKKVKSEFEKICKSG